ncbi:MAG: FUSC family protein [Alphaproteobacteria bacterium]|nr:FUSC family protein [Alphaproteobacteria bacterium]
MLREIPGALAAELRALEWCGRRGLEAIEAAAAVTLAVLVAQGVHSSEPWWAAITAFMVTRASPVEAISRGILRVAGSMVGAVAALVALRLFVYQSPPFLLCLFSISCIGLFGFVTSRYGYAWLVGSVTACLVMLMSFDQPQGAFATAVNRVIDVIIGTAASLVVCALSPVPTGAAAAPAPDLLDPPPLAFWRRGYGTELQHWLPGNVPLLMHACRGGLTVMLMPALAEWIAPVSPVTMGVTAVMVMSIPTTAIVHSDTSAIVQRAAHRLIGCLLGALVGLACLAFVGDDFLLWIALIPPGIWVCSQIQTGSTGISYIGTQAMFAYLMSMVQGRGPPQMIAPGFERLVGVMGGLTILFIVTLILSLIPLSLPTPASACDD